MSRSTRLFDLLQALRRHRRPVTAAALAQELGVSVRTIYRDIATLAGQGAPIDGEAGLARAAADASAKIAAVLPADLRDAAMAAGRLAGPGPKAEPPAIDLSR